MSTPSPAAVAHSRRPLTTEGLSMLVGDNRPLSQVTVVPTSPSTNTAVLAKAEAKPDEWPHMSALVADHQTAGRGRSGRQWQTPAAAACTISVVIRPAGVRRDAYGWAPLVVGLATVRALRTLGVGAMLKWPNDVVVEAGVREIPEWGKWRKVVGILCETVPGQDAIVAGIGINVSQSPGELPVPHAASLATLGATKLDRVALLRVLTAELADAVGMWEGTDDRGAIPASVGAVCATIGWDVAVDVPGASPVNGRAVGLSPQGGLLVETSSGERREILAGDVRVRRA
ncbi:biotin--[acetyl-CoA-carboxylase] ligase [Demequina aurantiaca]|uniref:biotin--[acetyl-CoA-carboxylase] ligase n=1 Tax=Demequina aurantiaca TaxID=676200 RepID=UPI001F00A2D4|nr:biotin--[acetyl-CoA-carboxylase] ligase [Demequina aurantiaca]